MPDLFHISGEFSKVDVERRIVGGWAITEKIDRQNDLIPYPVAQQAMSRFATESGAIREMHQPVAIGRLEDWQGDDAKKAIWVECYLSEAADGEDALTKVKEGILRGFSIGGLAKQKHMVQDGSKTYKCLDDLDIYEISLVDVPANPEARIVLCKLDRPIGVAMTTDANQYLLPLSKQAVLGLASRGAELLAKADGGLPDLARIPPSEGEPGVLIAPASAQPTEAEAGTYGGQLRPLQDDSTTEHGPAESVFAKAAAQKDSAREQLRQAQAQRAKRYGIAPKSGGHLTPPAGYPEDPAKYGDPVNYRYPVDPQRWQAALTYFNQREHQRQGGYSDREWSKLGRRIASLTTKESGTEHRFDPSSQTVQTVESKEKIMGDLIQKDQPSDLLSAIGQLLDQGLAAVDAGDAEGARDALSQAAAALQVAVDDVSDMESASESTIDVDTDRTLSSGTMTRTPASTVSGTSHESPESKRAAAQRSNKTVPEEMLSTRTTSSKTAASTATPRSTSLPRDSSGSFGQSPSGSTSGGTTSSPSSSSFRNRPVSPASPVSSESTESAELSSMRKGDLETLIAETVRNVLKDAALARNNAPAVAAVPRANGVLDTPIKKLLYQGNIKKALAEVDGDERVLQQQALQASHEMLRNAFGQIFPAQPVLNLMPIPEPD